MKPPLISVVMGVYNGEQYLREALESVLSQEKVNFEFIIVNDGSTDTTSAILSEYAAQDERIHVLNQDNLGLTQSLILGCNEARGKYIARQDADDISASGRLAKLLQFIESDKQFLFVSSWTEYIGPNGEKLHNVTRPSVPEDATQQLLHERKGPPAHGSVMFRKDAYEQAGGYRKQFYYAQDADLWLRMAQHGLVAYVPEYLYKYRYSAGAISSDRRDIQKRFGELGQACHAARMNDEPEEQFLKMAAELRDKVLSGEVERMASHKRKAASNYFLGSGLYEQRDPQARLYFWEVIKADPLHWRAWLKMFSSVIRHN